MSNWNWIGFTYNFLLDVFFWWVRIDYYIEWIYAWIIKLVIIILNEHMFLIPFLEYKRKKWDYSSNLIINKVCLIDTLIRILDFFYLIIPLLKIYRRQSNNKRLINIWKSYFFKYWLNPD